MITPDQNAFVVLYAIGVLPTLYLTSEEANTLTADDVELLREIGAGEAIFDQLRELAREPGRRLRLDFEQQTVAIEDPTA